MLNLSSRKLSDDEYLLLGKGLKFCPKTKSHDRVKLAEEIFKYTRRLRLKEYFYSLSSENNDANNTDDQNRFNLPFINNKGSTFTPSSGRDIYLDFYISAVTQEILQNEKSKKYFSNISKKELESLKRLSHDKEIIIKKADKSSTIVIMNRADYENEVNRQLHDNTYYEQLHDDPRNTIEKRITESMNSLESKNPNINTEFDTFPLNIRTPQFYILPKTHKTPNDNLPLKYPGRPIVSACNSLTENISKYVDHVLKPSMMQLPSFIKDTSDFISKIKDLKLPSKNSYFVTLDVTSLYTNIPHKDGVEALKYFLQKDDTPSRLSPEEIGKLAEIVLHNNYFQFGDNFYLQKTGTAMGSSMAPTYAALFMGKLEADFMKTQQLLPSVWYRFLDDIFMIWDHSLEDLHAFIDSLNSFHPNIKFTCTISQESVSFLDVVVSKAENLNIKTNVYVKDTNNHQYLDYTSCHPKRCKNGIPFSQAKRYRRIISSDQQFHECLPTLEKYFLDRNYPLSIIQEAFDKILPLSQNDALQESSAEKHLVIPFTITFCPSLPNIGEILNKYWDLLKLSPNESVRQVYLSYKPILAFRRPINLQDQLVRTAFSLEDNIGKSNICGKKRCTHCSNINVGSTFTSHVTGEKYKLFCNSDCTSKNVIYLVTCKKCQMQYVGQTSQSVSRRMNSHRFDICNFEDPLFSTTVATHFNSQSHSINDFSFMPIETVSNNSDRLCKETYWIHKLKTLQPSGLNAKALYNI